MNVGFQDTSALEKFGYNISLNMVATVCNDKKTKRNLDGFSVNHSAEKYVKPNFVKV
jgi:hypothetical protein